MSTVEHWLPVVGYEGIYEVSDHGNVRSMDRVTRNGHRRKGQPLKATPGKKSPYPRVNLARNGKVVTSYIHRLVLEAFVGPCPEGMEACHSNDVPDDNRLENLRWDTKMNNLQDVVRNGNYHPFVNPSGKKLEQRTAPEKGHQWLPEPETAAA